MQYGFHWEEDSIDYFAFYFLKSKKESNNNNNLEFPQKTLDVFQT